MVVQWCHHQLSGLCSMDWSTHFCANSPHQACNQSRITMSSDRTGEWWDSRWTRHEVRKWRGRGAGGGLWAGMSRPGAGSGLRDGTPSETRSGAGLSLTYISLLFFSNSSFSLQFPASKWLRIGAAFSVSVLSGQVTFLLPRGLNLSKTSFVWSTKSLRLGHRPLRVRWRHPLEDCDIATL